MKHFLHVTLWLVFVVDCVSFAQGTWWDANWSKRRRLVFSNTTQTEALVDFPVLIVLDASRIDYQETQDNGEDLRFIDADHRTILSYEIEKWDEVGRSYVWVKVPRIEASSNSDRIWVYYGNSRAADAQQPAEVWDSSFQAVWHMAQEPSGTPPQIKDSTFHANHGRSQGHMDSRASTPGKLGDALEFDGIDDYLDHGDRPALSLDRLTPFTLEAWIKTSNAVNQSILAKQSLQYRGYHLLVDNRPDPSGPYTLRLVMPHVPASNEIKVIGTTPLTDGHWHYVAVTYDGSSQGAGVILYVDGRPEASQIFYNSLRDSFAVQFPFYVANRGRGDMKFRGQLDEIRISSHVRSANWVQAQYQVITDHFVTFGAVEEFRR